jgi:hypothetical protein
MMARISPPDYDPMAARQRKVRPPLEQVHGQLLEVIAQSPEPSSARILARRLPAELRIPAAELEELLQADATAGRLFSSRTARGEVCYWDRDVQVVVREALRSLITDLEQPRTARELATALKLPFKVSEAELLPVLEDLVENRLVFPIPPATARGKPRFGKQPFSDYGIQELIRSLQVRGAQPATGLKKLLKWATSEQLGQMVDAGLASRQLWHHPAVGKSGKDLIGAAPPSPAKYLEAVGNQLELIVASLRRCGVSAEAIRRGIVEMLHAAQVEWGPTWGENLSPREGNSLTSGETLVALARRIEPAADRGALVTFRDLRRVAQLEKSQFDAAVLALARRERVSLHRHDFAANLSENELSELVTDGTGRYYIGMALRVGGSPSEE